MRLEWLVGGETPNIYLSQSSKRRGVGSESPSPFILPRESTTCLCVPANSSSVWRKPRRWTESCWTHPYERYRPTQWPSFLHQPMTRSPFATPRCPHNTRACHWLKIGRAHV